MNDRLRFLTEHRRHLADLLEDVEDELAKEQAASADARMIEQGHLRLVEAMRREVPLHPEWFPESRRA